MEEGEVRDAAHRVLYSLLGFLIAGRIQIGAKLHERCLKMFYKTVDISRSIDIV